MSLPLDPPSTTEGRSGFDLEWSHARLCLPSRLSWKNDGDGHEVLIPSAFVTRWQHVVGAAATIVFAAAWPPLVLGGSTATTGTHVALALSGAGLGGFFVFIAALMIRSQNADLYEHMPSVRLSRTTLHVEYAGEKHTIECTSVQNVIVVSGRLRASRTRRTESDYYLAQVQVCVSHPGAQEADHSMIFPIVTVLSGQGGLRRITDRVAAWAECAVQSRKVEWERCPHRSEVDWVFGTLWGG